MGDGVHEPEAEDTEAAEPPAGAERCPDCGGTGEIDGRECPACEGTGNVMRGLGGG
jgi:DnaJ-class molecular chaperone